MPINRMLFTPSEFLLEPGREYVANLENDPEWRQIIVWPSKKYPGFWHLYRLERAGSFIEETKLPVTPYALFMCYLDKYATTKFERRKQQHSDL